MAASISFRESGLQNLVDELPGFYCVIGDVAYVPSEKTVPVYKGTQALVPKNDKFNYYASQLRIRIEMAFGLMVQKWRILNSPLRIKIKNVSVLMTAVAFLHSYCMNERMRETIYEEPTTNAMRGIDYEFSAMRNYDAAIQYHTIVSRDFANWSLNRVQMTNLINKRKDLLGRKS